jgi:putative DNA primase/helicase
LVSHFIKQGFSDDAIIAMMERWATTCRPPTDEEDFRQMVRDCRDRGYSFGCNDDILNRFCSSDCHRAKMLALDPDQVKSLYFTDTGMAEAASKLFEGRLLYVEEAKAWLAWDGRRWVSGTPGGLYPFVKGMLQKMVQAAFDCDDADQKSAMLKELIKFQSFSRQTTVINAMAVLPELIVTSNQLDVDPMLLNCLSGVIDLTTGKLLPHDPAYRITRIVNCEYDLEADCPRFEKFLATIFQGNAELIGYIQRFIGYALTGKTSEQVLLFCYGKGANGKTSLLKVLLMLMADFTASAQAELLMVKDSRSGISNDLARLKGARLVTVNEVQEDARLNEAQIKTLTGITARFLFKEFFEFYPQFKLVLVGNHKPIIRGQDHGIWRRIHLLPFMATIPEDERDPDLLDKLKTELPGILAWAVRGCLQWQESGLKPPKEVVEAVNEYRQSEDIFGQWFNDCCVINRGAMSKSDLVYSSFVEHSGMNYITSHKLTKWLTERGFRQERKNTGRHWVGFDLKLTQPLCSEEG